LDDTERLTSYLDGELAADERRALEAELAGDHALRERLAALRTADRTLRAVGATELPPGARERLDDRLAGVLAEVLTTTSATAGPPLTATEQDDAPTPGAGGDRVEDELALRRRRRVLPAVTGVAAGLVLLAGGIVGLGQLGLDSDDAGLAEGADAMMSADDAAELESLPAAPELEALGPIVVDDGRATSTAELEGGPVSPELEAAAAAALSAEDGAALADRFQQLLLGEMAPAPSGPMAADEDEDAAEEAAEDAAEDADGADRSMETTLVTRDGRTLNPEDAADLRACLATLLEGGEQAIPIRVELLEVDQVPAIGVGLLTPDPTTGAFTRMEVWTLERASCQVLRFEQS
jgi:anti-sigma factor RsiW